MAVGALLGGLGGLLGGGASIFSGLFGGKSSTSGLEDAIRQAGQYQYQASQNAIEAQKQALQQAQQRMSPFYSAGTAGLGQYMNMLGLGAQGQNYDPTAWLSKTPGYEWALNQGVGAIDRSAAAKGLLKSGAQFRGLMDYGQNLALNKVYDPYMNRLSGLGSMGQSAAGLQGGWDLGTAGNIGNYLMQQGQSQADVAQQMGLANMLGNQNQWNRIMGGLGIVTGTLSNPQFTNALGSAWNKSGIGGGVPATPEMMRAYNTYNTIYG